MAGARWSDCGTRRRAVRTAAALSTGALALAALVELAGACSLVVDTDNLSGGTASGDGGEGGIPTDAIDAAADPNVFAESFDDVGLDRWLVKQIGGTVALDPASARTGASGAAVNVAENLAADEVQVSLSHVLGAARSIDCAVDLRVEKSETTAGSLSIFALTFGGKGASLVSYDGKKLVVFESLPVEGGAPTTKTMPLRDLAAGVWARVRIRTDFTTLRVTIDGVAAYESTTITSELRSEATTVVLGPAGDHDRGPYKFLYDDVRCELSR